MINGKIKIDSQSVKSTQRRGFTLVELLIALMITAIILTAATTMAGALSSGKAASDQAARDGAYLMQLNGRLSDLIMRANGVLSAAGQTIVLWHDHNGDGAGAISEYTTIESPDTEQLVIYNNQTPETKEVYSKCKDVQFWVDNADAAQIKNVTIQWNMAENGVSQKHGVCATLRGKN